MFGSSLDIARRNDNKVERAETIADFGFFLTVFKLKPAFCAIYPYDLSLYPIRNPRSEICNCIIQS